MACKEGEGVSVVQSDVTVGRKSPAEAWIQPGARGAGAGAKPRGASGLGRSGDGETWEGRGRACPPGSRAKGMLSEESVTYVVETQNPIKSMFQKHEHFIALRAHPRGPRPRASRNPS